MGSKDIIRRPNYFSACISQPCVPMHEEYARIPGKSNHRRNQKLRSIIRNILKEGKSCYGPPPKPITFQYDAVSYSNNFDDGCPDQPTSLRFKITPANPCNN